MATLTAGPGAVDGIDFTQFDITDIVKDAAGSSFKGPPNAATEVTFFGTKDSFDTFRGKFVITANGNLVDDVVSGTINEIEQFDNNQRSSLLTGLSMSVAQFKTFLNAGNSQGFLAAVFAAADSITGSDKNDNMHGFAGNDTVDGGAGNDTLGGDAGNDSLIGGLGDDAMDGGAGNDSYAVDSAADAANETVAGAAGGTDTVFSSAASYTLGLNIENLTLKAGAGDIDGTGNALANVITGNEGKNELAGGDGNDKLAGGANDDSLSGDGGNDTLDGGDGNDSLDGGTGADSMAGGKGDDVYFVDSLADKVSETVTNLAGGGSDTVNSSVTFTLGANLDNLKLLDGFAGINGTGNAEKNEITGNDGANKLAGMAANDTISGGAENDSIDGGTGADSMTGGAGDDSFTLDTTLDTVSEDALGGTDTVLAPFDIDLTLAAFDNIENAVLLGTGAFSALGDDAANSLKGNSGANNLIGGVGNDTLDGGTGADSMRGGADDDLYVIDNAGDKADELNGGGAGNDTIRSSITINLAAYPGIENVELTGTGAINATGTDGVANKLTGNDGANKLDGGTGDDTMDGGKGADTYFADVSTDQVSETLTAAQGGGIDTVFSKDSFKLGANIENLTLQGTGAFDATGNALNNVLTGNDGDNKIDGGKGNDSMAGGKGNDTYFVDSAGDKVTETLTNATGGIDTVISSATFTLGANVDNLQLVDGFGDINGTGNADKNEITGNDGANKLLGMAGNDTLTGNDGDDTLDGGAGDDSMAGGEDDDLYVVDSALDVFDEQGTTLGDELRTNQTLALAAGIEHYTYTGTKAVAFTGNAADNRITAAAAADSLAGGAGDDSLNGLGGNDTLLGDADNDQLDGGAGSDSMDGGAGNDIYFVDVATDKIADSAGTDEVRSTITFSLAALPGIENLTLLGTGAINATGNDGANVVTGNDGANKLDGGKGADEMAGGKGSDTYTVDSLGDTVTEGLNAGTDLVLSSVDFKLGDNVENLTLQGNAVAGEGNDLANAIIGNANDNELSGGDGKDTLTGNDGADTLDGGKGADSLIGGKGADVYVVDDVADKLSETLTLATGGRDRVESSVTFTLGANLDDLLLTGGSKIDGTGNTLDNALTGNDQGNKLTALAGKDTLAGGDGDDTLAGGAGNDSIDGGIGTDTAVFTGKIADYTIETVGGITTVTDKNGATNGDDGTDTLTDVEFLQFADKLVQIGVPIVFGTPGDDTPTLTSKADNYDGLGGNDTIDGLDGDDTLAGGAGNDSIEGGAGVDRVDFRSEATDGVVVDLSAGTVTKDGQGGQDKLSGIEDVRGSEFADAITGDGAANRLAGVGGDDTLTGGGGNDSMDGGGGADEYRQAVGDGDDVVTNADGRDRVLLTGVDFYDLNFDRIGNDLVLAAAIDGDYDFADTGSITFKDYYLGSGIAFVQIDTIYNSFYGTDPNITTAFFTTDLANGLNNATAMEVLQGSDKGDVINGNGGFYDQLYGAGGNDTITSGGSSDFMAGGTGNDKLLGNGGDDRLRGNAGNDTLDGGAGDDRADYRRAAGGIVLDLTAGKATNDGDGGQDTLLNIENVGGSQFADKITGSAGANFLFGRGGDDTIAAAGKDDTLDGGGGTDVYRHSGLLADGNDEVINADGNDIVVFTNPNFYDVNFFRDGDDLVVGGAIDANFDFKDTGSVRIRDHYAGAAIAFMQIDTASYNLDYGTDPALATFFFTPDIANGIDNTDKAEILLGTDADEVINANGGYYDGIFAGGGKDTVDGGAGFDNIRGQGGDDSLFGGADGDNLRGDQGNDTLDGGDGTDRARYDRASGGVIVDLGAGTATDIDGKGDSGTDKLSNIENVLGSDFDDKITGGDGDNRVEGRGGNDTIIGGAGYDQLYGEAGDDVLQSTDGDDLLIGGAGKDSLIGSPDDFVFAWYAEDPAGVIVNLSSSIVTVGAVTLQAGTARDGYGNVDNLTDIAAVGGTSFGDVIFGSDADNIFELRGGNDTAHGGLGFDLLGYDNAGAGVNLSLSKQGTAQFVSAGDGKDTFDGFEALGGTPFNDTLTGDGNDNLLYGRDGSDSLSGGGGMDTLRGGDGDDTITGGGGDDELEGFEGADTYSLSGLKADGNDVIFGDGNDIVVFTNPNFYDINFFRDGNDLVVGGAIDGNFDFADTGSVRIRDHYAGAAIAFVQIDTEFYNLDYGTDPAVATFFFTPDIANGIDNTDTAEILLGTDVGEIINGNGGYYDGFYAGGGNDTVNGGDGFDNIRGQDGDDSLFGGADHDNLRGDQGNDTLDGGAGVDRARYDNASGGVIVDLGAGTAVQADVTGNSGTDKLLNIEDVRGSNFADTITGDGSENRLEGRGGDDLLVGGLGRDQLQGDGGNDTLDGGDGRDQVRYSSSSAGVVVDLAGGTAQDGFGTIDTLISIERVVGSSHNDKLAGDVDIFASLLGSKGNDTIDGAGNGFASYFDSPAAVNANLATGTASDGWGNTDKLSNLQGLSGSDFNDTLTGDGKDNWFEGAAGKDSINGGAGNDVVDYNFPDGGVTVDLGAGTATDNFGFADKLVSIENIWASNSADKLTGSTVNNEIWGAGGNDTMTGGAGADTFDFSGSVSEGADVITDFAKATDKLLFFDVIDSDADTDFDIADLNAAITNVHDNGVGNSVVVTFNNGGTITFNGAGTGSVNSIDDLVADPATQIIVHGS